MRSSQRVVKKRLADGTVKTYTYARKAQQSRFADDTLGALILEYKRSPEWAGLADATHRTYNVYLKVLEADPHTRASAVTRRDILALRDAVATTRGNGAATGFIRAASALFSWAVDREWIDNTPVTRIKSLPGGSLPPWSASHAAHALARLSEPLRRAVVLALRTGQRRGDLVAMRWDADDGAVLRFRPQKTGAEMAIPVGPELRSELDAWRRTRCTLTILDNGAGAPWVAPRLTEQLARALAKIGMAGLGIHGVRKLMAANLADRGASTHEIAAVTGHRTLSMVALYTRSVDQEKLASSALSRLSERKVNRTTIPRKSLKIGQ